MISRVGNIPILKTITALRGNGIRIDLGKTFEGDLFAWMKKSPNSTTHREFTIEDNRHLALSNEETLDYRNSSDVPIDSIQRKWNFENNVTELFKKVLDDGELEDFLQYEL